MVIFEEHKLQLRKASLSIFLLFFLAVQQVLSQQARHYSFTHYGTNEGVMSNEVTAAVQDNVGYIWIGSTNGLQRFDGTRFKTFRTRKNDTLSLPANYVYQLLVDKKNNLWLQAGGRAGIFDTKKFVFKEARLPISDQFPLNAQRILVQDEEGNIFFVFLHWGILRYDEKNNEFVPAADFIHYPPGWKIVSLYQLPGTKKYIIGTLSGIAIYNRQTDQLSYTGHNVEKEGLIDKLGNLQTAVGFMLDNNNRLWFHFWDGGVPSIYAYDIIKSDIVLDRYNLMKEVGGYHELGGFLQQRDGTIWARGLGVFAKYLEKEKRFENVYNGYENEQSISFTRVDNLFEDKEDNVWVVTNNNGLYRFNPSAQFFTNIHQLNRAVHKPGDGSPMSFIRTRQGTLLMGAWGDGLYQYDKDYNVIPLNIHGFDEKFTPSMWGMWASRDSNIIWMGSQPGIWMVDQAKRSAVFYNPPALKERTVRQIAEDRFGNLWLGTQSIGLYKWDAKEGKTDFNKGIKPYPGIPVSLVSHINIDSKGYVWVATTTFGLYVIDPATDSIILHFGSSETMERKLKWDGVAATLEYDDSTMVIAANGLYFYDTHQHRITRIIALPESIPGLIAAMEKDKRGYIWVSTTSGILRVNPKNEIFIHFDRLDGIGNDHFIIAASYTMPDGKMLFGADNQFVVFDPMKVHINESAPDVIITGFKLMNASLEVDSLLNKNKVRLGPEDNSITIEFSGLRYNGTYAIRYKLENLDKDWITADKNNQAIYSYLPPGTYTFNVQSLDAEGIPGKNITSLVITVEPPFWKTWWFFCLLALMVAAIFYWLDKQRINKLIALHAVRTEIASNLHQEVNTTLNNINLLSEMARIKADKDIELSKEFIDQISNKSHNMIIAMDDIMWSIDPQNDSMEKSLLRMLEFADALKNRYGANIELALDKKVRLLRPDMKTRHEVFLIFKEALRMIVQYSGGRETLVHIDLFKNKLSIKLQDATASLEKNVEDIDNSIREMNNRSALINADLDVQYDKKGVAVILLVPVK